MRTKEVETWRANKALIIVASMEDKKSQSYVHGTTVPKDWFYNARGMGLVAEYEATVLISWSCNTVLDLCYFPIHFLIFGFYVIFKGFIIVSISIMNFMLLGFLVFKSFYK